MASNAIDVTWEGKRQKAVEQARAIAMPLTFGKVFLAVFLGNILTAVVIGIAYAIVTAR